MTPSERSKPDWDDEAGNWFCSRCKCCSADWVRCDGCDGDGFAGHDCGEDCCCCANPEENVTCDTCDGEGGWWQCLGECDKDGKHIKRAKLKKGRAK